MKVAIAATLLAASLTGSLFAQAQKVPQPKSQAELDAVKALFAANGDPDATIKLAEELTTKYKDTEFKETALILEANAYKMKGDNDRAEVYAEQVLQVNPKSFQASLMIGELTAQAIRENDLNRAEEVAKAEKYLNQTIEVIKTADKPNPNFTDEQWAGQKKIVTAEAQAGIGIAAMADKKWDKAITNFKTANELDPEEPVYLVRLAKAYQSAGKHDEAIAACDKVLAMANVHPQVKAAATGIKADSVKAKGGK
jgi:tetratricopeptide (TPR) repeat protein